MRSLRNMEETPARIRRRCDLRQDRQSTGQPLLEGTRQGLRLKLRRVLAPCQDQNRGRDLHSRRLRDLTKRLGCRHRQRPRQELGRPLLPLLPVNPEQHPGRLMQSKEALHLPLEQA